MWADYENDQDLDLFVTGLAQAGLLGTNHLFEVVGGRFSAATALSVSLAARAVRLGRLRQRSTTSTSTSPAATSTPNQLLRNNTGEPQHGPIALLAGRRTATASARPCACWRTAACSTAWCRAGRASARRTRSRWSSGWARRVTADSVVVDWPSGKRSILVGLRRDRTWSTR
jgi:hypothetical protein